MNTQFNYWQQNVSKKVETGQQMTGKCMFIFAFPNAG